MRSSNTRGAAQVTQLVQTGIETYGRGDRAGALEIWRRALAIAPDDVRVRAYVSWGEWCLENQSGELLPGETLVHQRTALLANAAANSSSTPGSSQRRFEPLAPLDEGPTDDRELPQDYTSEFVAQHQSSETVPNTAEQAGRATHTSETLSLTNVRPLLVRSRDSTTGTTAHHAMPRTGETIETTGDDQVSTEARLLARLSPLDRIVVTGKQPSRLKPQAAFLLTHADGTLTLEDLVDVSGLPRVEAFTLLAQLLDEDALVFT